jgi:hypothetical protein
MEHADGPPARRARADGAARLTALKCGQNGLVFDARPRAALAYRQLRETPSRALNPISPLYIRLYVCQGCNRSFLLKQQGDRFLSMDDNPSELGTVFGGVMRANQQW